MNEGYNVAIFESIYHLLCAEKTMKAKGLEYKIVPVPWHISSDCGVCLRFRSDIADAVADALSGEVGFEGIYVL